MKAALLTELNHFEEAGQKLASEDKKTSISVDGDAHFHKVMVSL